MTRSNRGLAVLTSLLLVTLAAGGAGANPEDSAATPAAENAPRLAQTTICENVEDRAPIGAAESFSSQVGRLWCFTDVRGATPPTEIFHRWYVGDDLVSEIPITVRAERWRCWSRKTIRPGWSGACRVEVLTEEGDLLGTAEFVLE